MGKKEKGKIQCAKFITHGSSSILCLHIIDYLSGSMIPLWDWYYPRPEAEVECSSHEGQQMKIYLTWESSTVPQWSLVSCHSDKNIFTPVLNIPWLRKKCVPWTSGAQASLKSLNKFWQGERRINTPGQPNDVVSSDVLDGIDYNIDPPHT